MRDGHIFPVAVGKNLQRQNLLKLPRSTKKQSEKNDVSRAFDETGVVRRLLDEVQARDVWWSSLMTYPSQV